MAKQIIGLGSAANDGTGDPLRTAFTKANGNFTELYAAVATIPAAYTLPAATTTTLGGVKVGTGLAVAGDGTLTVTATGSTATASRTITAAGDVTALSSDYLIKIKKTTGVATTVTLPANPATGTTYIIKDAKGDAATNNITVSGNGHLIDGAATFAIVNAYNALTVVFGDDAVWTIV